MGYKDRDTITSDAVNIMDGEDLVDDVANRPHSQSFTNEDYLASVVNADRTFVIQGGGVLSWQTDDALKFAWSERLRIEWANEEIGGSDVGGSSWANINAGSVTFSGSQRLVAIRISRSTPATYAATSPPLEKFISFDEFKTQLETLAAGGDQAARFEYVVLAVRERNSAGAYTGNLILWNGQKMVGPAAYSDVGPAPTPPSVTTFGSYLTHDGARDSQYAQQESLNDLNTIADQDRNTLLMGGGLMTWSNASGIYRLITTSDLYVYLPTGVYVKVAAQTWPVIAPSQGYKITISRSTGTTTQTPVVVDLASVSDSGDNLIIVAAMHTDNRLYLRDGSAFDPGQKRYLGGGTTGLKWVYEGPGNGSAVLDFAGSFPTGGFVSPTGVTPEFLVGGTELLVFVNGQLKRRDVPGSTFTGDYREIGTLGALSTRIQWMSLTGPPQTRIPTSSDWVQCFVGLAYARGEVGPAGGVNMLLQPGGSEANNLVGDVSFQSDDTSVVITKDAGDNALDFSVASSVRISQGQKNAVNGTYVGGAGGVDGAMFVFGHRPRVAFSDPADPTHAIVSPGEIPVPTDGTRATFRVLRNYTPTVVDIEDAGTRTADFVIASGATAPVYFYAAVDADAVHDAPFVVQVSTSAPIGSYWLTHPTEDDLIYIGSAIVVFNDPDYAFIPFDCEGNILRFRPQPALGGGPPYSWSDTGAPMSANPYSAVTLDSGDDLEDVVPPTASAVLLSVAIVSDGTGSDETGVALGSAQLGASLLYGTIGDEIADVILWTHLGVSQTHSWSEVRLPLNSLSGTDPSTPEINLYVGGHLVLAKVTICGYVEGLPRTGTA